MNSSASPLYLHNGSVTKLDIDAAGRLRIERPAQPERMIPLHHVSRIVCSNSLDISARALMACLEGGVPVAVVDRHGKSVGWCLGKRRKETTLSQLLTHAIDDPQWDPQYQLWLELHRSSVAAHTLLMCGVPTTASARYDPRAALCNAHVKKHQTSCAAEVDAVAALAQHELAYQLAKTVSEPQHLAWHRAGLNLIEDLGSIIGLHAHTDVHHVMEVPNTHDLTRWSIRVYERHTAHWQQRMANTLYAFEQFLRLHWL